MNKQKFIRFIKKKSEDPEYYRTITFEELISPITVLLGPNGSGKSRSLLELERYAEKHEINLVKYSTSRDDIVTSYPSFNPVDLLSAFRSEGERMTDSFIKWAQTKFIKKLLSNQEPLLVILDEIDSGLSIDRIRQQLEQFIEVIKSEVEKKRDIKVVITCNSYEMYEYINSSITKYYWIPTKEYVEFNSYEEFKEPYNYFYSKYYN